MLRLSKHVFPFIDSLGRCLTEPPLSEVTHLADLSESCPSPHPKPVQSATARRGLNLGFIGVSCLSLARVMPFGPLRIYSTARIFRLECHNDTRHFASAAVERGRVTVHDAIPGRNAQMSGVTSLLQRRDGVVSRDTDPVQGRMPQWRAAQPAL